MADRIISKRNREFFVDNGFKYTYDRHNADGTIIFGRCEFKNDCKVRIRVRDCTIIKQLHEHSRESNSAGLEVTRIVNNIKRRAIEIQEVSYFLKVLV